METGKGRRVQHKCVGLNQNGRTMREKRMLEERSRGKKDDKIILQQKRKKTTNLQKLSRLWKLGSV